MYPRMHPIAVLMSTLTGMNHQCRTLSMVTDLPRWTKIRQGSKSAKTSLLRSLKVALGTTWTRGLARSRPMTVRHSSFISGATTAKIGATSAELEEERSAAAIAANQMMAMINRLQEEKAAIQMEALQYQRMMEEQSEYDQV